MTEDEIMKYAAMGKRPAGEMTCAERCLFLEAKEMYALFRSGRISKLDGEKQKAEILRRFREDEAEIEAMKRQIEWPSKLWRKIEMAGSVYCKEPTIEHADEFVKAVYGVERKKLKV